MKNERIWKEGKLKGKKTHKPSKKEKNEKRKMEGRKIGSKKKPMNHRRKKK